MPETAPIAKREIPRSGDGSVPSNRRRAAFIGMSDPARAVVLVRQGVDSNLFEWLKNSLEVSDGRLAGVVRISQRTVKRRLREGKFHPDESERLLRIAKLTARAQDVFGDLEGAREWLKSPQFALGGEIPLEYADTEPGAQVVEDVLGRLEHGIPV
jgi:putative toxin-antitoxin system antitoxin component (TIGR02293 family)